MNFVDKDLPKVIWLFLPVAVFILPYASQAFGENTGLYLYKEGGWIEVSTVIFLVVAIIFGAALLKAKNFPDHGWFWWWIVLLVLGSVYFAGEEISWGQHIFGWQTPQVWLGVNDQYETNLHNTSPLFDQVPRTLLSTAVLIGGVLVPLYRIITGNSPERQSVHYWLWPTRACLPVALFSLLVSWHEKMYGVLNVEIPAVLDIKAGEAKEGLLALFIMIYVLSIWYRNRFYRVATNLNNRRSASPR